MSRKRKDPFTSLYLDRHGKERCRFRRDGFGCSLPHPSAKGYREAYEKALQGLAPRSEPRAKPETIGALVPRFYESLAFKKGGAAWQKTVRQVLEPFRLEFVDDKVRNFKPEHVEVILSRKIVKRAEGKRIVGGLSAANRLRDQLDRLFAYAVKLEWIGRNPVPPADEMPKHKGSGFYPWSEEDIAQFRDQWALGTKPRLAMEMILWTGLRRGDAHLLPPPKGERFMGKAGKTGKEFDFPVAPPLLAAIEAMPAVGLTTLLVTDYGKPFSVAGFGNWFKDKCVEAGLPQCTAHGLRKALARRAASQGVSQQGLKAVGQWSGDREVAIYVENADRRGLADNAIQAVHEWERDANIV